MTLEGRPIRGRSDSEHSSDSLELDLTLNLDGIRKAFEKHSIGSVAGAAVSPFSGRNISIHKEDEKTVILKLKWEYSSKDGINKEIEMKICFPKDQGFAREDALAKCCLAAASVHMKGLEIITSSSNPESVLKKELKLYSKQVVSFNKPGPSATSFFLRHSEGENIGQKITSKQKKLMEDAIERMSFFERTLMKVKIFWNKLFPTTINITELARKDVASFVKAYISGDEEKTDIKIPKSFSGLKTFLTLSSQLDEFIENNNKFIGEISKFPSTLDVDDSLESSNKSESLNSEEVITASIFVTLKSDLDQIKGKKNELFEKASYVKGLLLRKQQIEAFLDSGLVDFQKAFSEESKAQGIDIYYLQANTRLSDIKKELEILEEFFNKELLFKGNHTIHDFMNSTLRDLKEASKIEASYLSHISEKFMNADESSYSQVNLLCDQLD